MEVTITVEILTGAFHLAGKHFLIMRGKEGKMKPTQLSKSREYKVIYLYKWIHAYFSYLNTRGLLHNHFTQ